MLGINCGPGGCAPDLANYAWYDPAFGPPGTKRKYSNSGYLMAQAILERSANNTPFHHMIQNWVFTPLGMTDSRVVDQPMNAAWEDRAAHQHDSTGTPLERRIYWWAAAGGVYASARDYARAVIPLLNGGKTEDGTDFLSQTAVDTILQNNPPQSFYGLGLGLSESQVSPAGGFFRHKGLHTDRARSLVVGRPDRKQALVVFMNAGHGASNTLIEELQTAFWSIYGWN
jgi:CubicO group peptidase (beta-lactamase class C family)